MRIIKGNRMGKGMTGKVVSVCGSCSRFIFACLEVNVYHFPRDWPNTGLSTQPLNDRVSLLYLFHCYVRLNRNIWFIFRECNSFWEYQLIPFHQYKCIWNSLWYYWCTFSSISIQKSLLFHLSISKRFS